MAGRPIDTSEAYFQLQAHGADHGFTASRLHGPRHPLRVGVPRHLGGEGRLRGAPNRPALAIPPAHQSRRRHSAPRVGQRDSRGGRPPRTAYRRRRRACGPPFMGTIRAIAKSARSEAGSHQERLWLGQLVEHLENYAAMSRTNSNSVFIVSLGSGPMVPGGVHTWIDVVNKDKSYFHPVGKTWPKEPPNYAFRYGGQVRSVHKIETYKIVRDVSTLNTLWIPTTEEHLVYRLGPPMTPARSLRAAVPRRHRSAKRTRLGRDRHAALRRVRSPWPGCRGDQAPQRGGKNRRRLIGSGRPFFCY